MSSFFCDPIQWSDTTETMDTFASRYVVDVTTAVGPGYATYLDDVVRMLCIQLTIQTLISLSNGANLLSVESVLIILYVVLGVSLYWLVFKRLVRFR